MIFLLDCCVQRVQYKGIYLPIYFVFFFSAKSKTISVCVVGNLDKKSNQSKAMVSLFFLDLPYRSL